MKSSSLIRMNMIIVASVVFILVGLATNNVFYGIIAGSLAGIVDAVIMVAFLPRRKPQ